MVVAAGLWGGEGMMSREAAVAEAHALVDAPRCFKREAPASPIALMVEREPPCEVRTRNPREARSFSFIVRLHGPYEQWRVHSVEARLVYADGFASEMDLSAVFGGRKRVNVRGDTAVFEGMSLYEASTRHQEREFAIVVTPINVDNEPLHEFAVRTRGIYAFSHNKILNRRKRVHVSCVSRAFVTATGCDRLHLIGGLFLKGPLFGIRVQLPSGEVLAATDVDVVSDSLLYFSAPRYPLPILGPVGAHVTATLQVSNDGRTYSSPVPLYYLRNEDLQFIPGLHDNYFPGLRE